MIDPKKKKVHTGKNKSFSYQSERKRGMDLNKIASLTKTGFNNKKICFPIMNIYFVLCCVTCLQPFWGRIVPIKSIKTDYEMKV